MKEKDQILLESAYDGIIKKGARDLPPAKDITYKWDYDDWKPVTKKAKPPKPVRPKGFFDLKKQAEQYFRIKKLEQKAEEARIKREKKEEMEREMQEKIKQILLDKERKELEKLQNLSQIQKSINKRKELRNQTIKDINPTGAKTLTPIIDLKQNQEVEDILDRKKREEDSRQKAVEDYIQHLHKKYNS